MPIAEGIKRGTVEVLILHLLREGDMYGYQLSQELRTRSHGLYTLQETSLYPSLYRMLEKGLISDRQIKVGKRRTRVYYHLEPKGEAHYQALRKEYLSLCQGLLSILEINSIADMQCETGLPDSTESDRLHTDMPSGANAEQAP